jgi:hypothetical protein
MSRARKAKRLAVIPSPNKGNYGNVIPIPPLGVERGT